MPALALGVLSPPPAEAQAAGKVPRIGIVAFGSCAGSAESAFAAGLRDLGYVEGKNVVVECRSAGQRYERLPEAAAELVRLRADVIVALNHPGARAAQEATSTIPIVMVASGDPVAAGFVASLSRPGGNMTGLSYYATELTAKRLELLKEMAPKIGRVAVLANPHVAYFPFLDDTKRAARALGLRLQILEVSDPGDLDRAFAAMAGERADALFVLPDLMFSRQSKQIADLALRHRLPMMSWGAWFAETGGLMTYSADYAKLSRRAAAYAHKILTGTRPEDLPVEQPTTFSLVINLKTAKALGLAIPPSLLLRADRVIE